MATYSTIPTSSADEEALLNAPQTTKPRRRLAGAALVAVCFALGATVAYVAPSKSSASAELDTNHIDVHFECTRLVSTGETTCSPYAIAKAWKEFEGGAYAADCVNAMTIALGEGAIPSNPLTYIHEYCVDRNGNSWADCFEGPGGGPGSDLSFSQFLHDTRIFPLNQEPLSDDQDTLGPWQTFTDVDSTNDINLRIREAIGYVENCCMDGDITVDVPSGSAQLWCPNVGTDPQYPPADCVNQVDGACTNPNHPDSNRFPISTILRSNISPRALTWCGCTANGDPTTGYSGRCFGDRDSDYYTKYKDFKPPSWGSLTEGLAVEICNRA